jgi:hypothetical protein
MARRVLPGRRVFAVVRSAPWGAPVWPNGGRSADDWASSARCSPEWDQPGRYVVGPGKIIGAVSYPPGGEYSVWVGIPPGGQLAAGGGPHCSLRGQQLVQPARVAPTTATAVKPSSLFMTSLPVIRSNRAPGPRPAAAGRSSCEEPCGRSAPCILNRANRSSAPRRGNSTPPGAMCKRIAWVFEISVVFLPHLR